MAAIVANKVKRQRSSRQRMTAGGESNSAIQLQIDKNGQLVQTGGRVLENEEDTPSLDPRTKLKYEYYKRVRSHQEPHVPEA